MIAVGSTINVVTGVAALVAFAMDLPTWAGAAIFLSPLPWNVFLTVAVWRAAARPDARHGAAARVAAAIWLLVSILV
jgi:uncharacterized membrane protein YozB (DUF420 family)